MNERIEYVIPIPMMSLIKPYKDTESNIINLSKLRESYKPCLIVFEEEKSYFGYWLHEFSANKARLREFKKTSTRTVAEKELRLFWLRPHGPNNPRRFHFIRDAFLSDPT